MVKRPLVEKDSDPEYAGAASIEALVLALLDGLNTLEAQDVSPEIRPFKIEYYDTQWLSSFSEEDECFLVEENLPPAYASSIAFPYRCWGISSQPQPLSYILRVAAAAHRACANFTVTTKRDLYYDDPELFECQRKSDETLATLCSILQCSRLDIGVVAASRGLLLGDISLHSGVNNGSSNSNETHADHITPEEFSCASYGNTIMGSEASTQLSSASSFGSPFESSIGWHASTLSSSSPPSHDCISPSSSSSSAHLHPPACALLIPRAVPCVSSYNLEAWASSSEPLFRINSIRFVLVVEKETVFQRLAGGMATTETCFAQFSSSPSSSLAFSQSRSSFASSSPPVSSGVSSSTFPSRSFATKHNCLIVTSKGYPNVNTRTFLRMVQVQYPHLPFFCLTDADPHGINIFLQHRFGTRSQARDCPFGLHNLTYIGLRLSDLVIPSSSDSFSQPAAAGSSNATAIVKPGYVLNASVISSLVSQQHHHQQQQHPLPPEDLKRLEKDASCIMGVATAKHNITPPSALSHRMLQRLSQRDTTLIHDLLQHPALHRIARNSKCVNTEHDHDEDTHANNSHVVTDGHVDHTDMPLSPSSSSPSSNAATVSAGRQSLVDAVSDLRLMQASGLKAELEALASVSPHALEQYVIDRIHALAPHLRECVENHR